MLIWIGWWLLAGFGAGVLGRLRTGSPWRLTDYLICTLMGFIAAAIWFVFGVIPSVFSFLDRIEI